MRLISLDFDGVLHSVKAGPFDGKRFMWVPLLADLLDPFPDVRISVHSVWRLSSRREDLEKYLKPLDSRFIGIAPIGRREEAIKAFVQSLDGRLHDWIVIDDAGDEFTELGPDRLILCDPDTGLSAPDVQQRLKDWLEGRGR